MKIYNVNYYLTDLEYTDDTILLTSYNQLRDALDIISEEAEKLALCVSWTKTKFMHVSAGPDPPSLWLCNYIVEPVKNFVYLEFPVTDDRDLKPEIHSIRALQSLGAPFLKHKASSCKTNLWIYNSAALSILHYSAEKGP